MVDGVWSGDGEGDTMKTINQDKICQRAVFLVWNERAERSELVGWVRYLSQCWGEFVPERRDRYGYGAIGKFQ